MAHLASNKASPSYLASYLPSSIVSYANEHEHTPLQPPAQQNYETAVLFADVSGYTAMCEKLAALGAGVGEEHLAKNLNSYFELLIKALSGQGGDVFKFAGDAILVVWPPSEEDLTTLTRRAVQAAINIQANFQDALLDTALNVRLSVKIGIGAGPISILHLGGVYGRLEYLAIGEPLVQAFHAEHHATQREIYLSPSAWLKVAQYFNSTVTDDGYAMIDTDRIKGDPKDQLKKKNIAKFQTDLKSLSESCLAKITNYIPNSIVPFAGQGEDKWINELRTISVLFVNLGVGESELVKLNTPKAVNRIHNVLKDVQTAVYKYEGSLNKFLMDDKGSTLIAVFGLPPLAHEDDSYRAVVAADAIRTALHQHDLRPSIGITTGAAFCGVVGNRGRREYSVLGDIVNLSARLMQHATVSGAGILCDTPTRDAALLQAHAWSGVFFDDISQITVKGKSAPVDIWQPIVKEHSPEMMTQVIKQMLETEKLSSVSLINSDTELKPAQQLLVSKFSPGPGGTVLIKADPGFGKTKLLCSSINMAPATCHVELCLANPFDAHTPFLVWRRIFANLFEAAGISKTCRRWIRSVLGEERAKLAATLNPILHRQFEDTEETEDMTIEMKLEHATSLVPFIFKAFPLALNKTVVAIVIDDAHYMDWMSWKFSACFHSIPNVVLVLSTRPCNVTYQNKFAQEIPPTGYTALLSQPTNTLITIKKRSDTLIQMIAARSLVGPSKTYKFKKSLLRLIEEKARGSPLIAKSLVIFFQKKGLLEVLDENMVVLSPTLCPSKKEREDMEAAGNPKGLVCQLPLSLAAMESQRVDRLTLPQQHILKVGSVIGNIFPWSCVNLCYPLDRTDLDRPLEDELVELVELGVIEEVVEPGGVSEGNYRFSSGTMRDTLLSRLLSGHQAMLVAKIKTNSDIFSVKDTEDRGETLEEHKKLFQESLFEGTLNKRGGRIKTWKSRYFVLYTEKLIYYKDENAISKNGGIKGEIGLHHDTKIECHLSGKQNMFAIIPAASQGNHVTFELYGRNQTEVVRWIRAIENQLVAKRKEYDASHGQSISGFARGTFSSRMTDFRTSQIQAELEKEVPVPKVIKESKREGFMMKRGDSIKTWKKRYFILANGTLDYYQTNNIKTRKGSITIYRTASVEVVQDVKFSFSISTEMGGRRYFITAKDQEDVDGWIQDLTAAMKEAGASKEEKVTLHSVLEGKLRKKGGPLGQWRKRHFVLLNDKLQYFDDEGKKEKESWTPKGDMKLYRDTQLTLDANDPAKFTIKTFREEDSKYKTFMMWAQSKEEAQTWINKIKEQLAIRPASALA